MTEYELEKFCERNPDCGCNCIKRPAFAQMYNDTNYDNEERED